MKLLFPKKVSKKKIVAEAKAINGLFCDIPLTTAYILVPKSLSLSQTSSQPHYLHPQAGNTSLSLTIPPHEKETQPAPSQIKN